ncbi:hypothetical protein DUI87_10679 [Hirundo rustica rustica]|uniref:Uncharacterized protein n=1 Tax=Hirundo rustica rustica TaxID=333673 RepID=A0A3M0KIS0_HIRRU|nr:hypothetical protein DUI87_10679 [Hirundo rustica rustica]
MSLENFLYNLRSHVFSYRRQQSSFSTLGMAKLQSPTSAQADKRASTSVMPGAPQSYREAALFENGAKHQPQKIGHGEWNSFSHFLWSWGLEKTKPTQNHQWREAYSEQLLELFLVTPIWSKEDCSNCHGIEEMGIVMRGEERRERREEERRGEERRGEERRGEERRGEEREEEERRGEERRGEERRGEERRGEERRGEERRGEERREREERRGEERRGEERRGGIKRLLCFW